MKNIITTLALFLATTLCASADNIDLFEYTITKGVATISKYIGAEKDIVVPSTIGNSTSCELEGLIEERTDIDHIYIPQDVTIKNNIVGLSNYPFKSAILYEECLKSQLGPFQIISTSIKDNSIDNIIIIGDCNLATKDLVGNDTNNYLFRAGTIEIVFTNTIPISLTIYLFGPNTKVSNKSTFGKRRFEDVLWAIDHCMNNRSNLNDVGNIIQSIDLRGLTGTYTLRNYGVIFAFDSETYNPASALNIGATVITPDKTYTHEAPEVLTITDKQDYFAPITNIENSAINYYRTNTQGWNSVCLPFDIKETDFPEGTKIYTFSGVSKVGEEDCINLSRLNEGTLEAGTPCYIWCDNKTTEWNLQLTGRTIAANVKAKTVEHNGWQLIGALQTQTIGAGKYKLNDNGSELGPTNSEDATVTALRCYFSPTQTKTNARIAVSVDDTAAITQVSNDSCAESVRVYDLLGRTSRRQGIELRRGNIRLTF